MADFDYEQVDYFTLIIPAGERTGSASFRLTGTDDEVAGEGDETLTVSGRSFGFQVSDATLTIIDGDTFPAISLSLDPDRVEETESAIPLTVTAAFPENSNLLASDTEISLSVGDPNDSATPGADYAAVEDFTVTIPAGQTSGSNTFSLSGTDDDAAGEGSETITVSGAATGFTISNATATLVDGDAVPARLVMTADTAKVAEGSGTARVTVTAALPEGSAAAGRALTVLASVGAADDTAAAGTDYQRVSGLRVTIPAGARSGTAQFDLAVTDDNLVEGSESLSVSGTLAGYAVTGTSIAISDNDAAPTSIALAANPAQTAERAGSATVTVTASFPAGSAVLTSDTTVTVSVGAEGDGAVSGSDYAAVRDFTVTIPAGQTSGSGRFSLSGTDDDVAGEGAESLSVSGSATGFKISGASLSITDGDAAPTRISLTVDPVKAGEISGKTKVTVRAAFPAGSPVLASDTAVAVSVGAEGDSATSGADYTAVDGFNVTIPAGQSSGSGSFSLSGTVDGLAGEGLESLSVSGSASGFTVSGTSVSLTDGDAVPARIVLSVDPVTVVESSGKAAVTVRAAFPDGSAARAAATAVAVSVGAEGDGAVSGADYAAVANFSVTIPAGQSSGSGSFSLSGTADGVAGEGVETLLVSGSAAGFTVSGASVSITDGDAVPTRISLTVDPGRVAEGSGRGAVTVRAAFPDGSAVRIADTVVAVSVGAADDTAVSGTDYAAVDGFNVTIPAGQSSGSGSFSLSGTDDDVAGEGAETVSVSGSASGFKVSGTSVSITDGDAAPTRIVLSVDPVKAAEGAKPVEVTVSAAFPDGSAVRTADTVVAVLVGAQGDSATSGSDYAAVDGFNVTIPAGESSGSGRFSLSGTADGVSGEGVETLSVSGSASGFKVSGASVSITDGDALPTEIGLTADPSSVQEGAKAQQVTVTASYADGSTVRAADTVVAVSVGADGDSATSGSDYAAVDGFNVTIPAGKASGSGRFSLSGTADGVAGEGVESLSVSGAVSGFTVSGASVSITDGDAVPTRIVLSVDPGSVGEGSGKTVVTVSAAFPAGSATRAVDTVVAVSVGADDDSAVSGSDYAAVSGFNVTIPAGERSGSGSFSLSVLDDKVAGEGSELLSVSGSADGFKVSGSSVSITDDDGAVVSEAVVGLSVSPSAAAEGDGVVSVRVSASLPAGVVAPAGGVSVAVSVGAAGDSAAAGSDYGRVDGFSVSIGEGKSGGWAEFRWSVSDDGVVEGAESVTVSGAASGYVVSSAKLTINDNDQAEPGGGVPGPVAQSSPQDSPPPPPADPTPASASAPAPPPPSPPPPPPPPADPPPAPVELPPADPPVGPLVGGSGEDVCVGRFCDEDGSVHQENIELAAEWGITNGCGEGRFCPGLSITRSQMAAFLYRAVARQSGGPPVVGDVVLSDVGVGAWYGTFARWAVSSGVIDTRSGGFVPGGVVTRGDMVVMLAAAFPALSDGAVAEGLFEDLGADGATARAAEALFRAGVTNGCSTVPLRFCPDQPVTRSQMASFFVRALTTLP